MKKKIFHFVSTNILSGLENMVINISTLVKGYDYTYVSPDGPINDYLDNIGIKHISIKKMTPFYVRKILKKYNPDIVQGHDVKASISLAFNYSICKKKNIKIISELHSNDPRMNRLTIRSILYRLSSPYYDQVIIVSKSIIDNYIFHRSIQQKTTVIGNVVNPFRIKNGANFAKDNLSNWDCIFIGRFSQEKNPLLFVKIIYDLKKYNKDISAIMLGNGPLKDLTNDLINKYNLSNNIKLFGFQSNPYKYLNKSKILIIPSSFEGFGLVALESLIIGVPVVGSSVGGLINVINDDCGGLANSEKDFVEKIKEILFNNSLYNKKKINTYYQANKINDINNFVNEYKYIYEN